MRAGLSARFFGISITLAGLLIFALVFRNDFVDESPARNVFFPRQVSPSTPANSSPAAAASSTTPAASSTQQAASTSNTPAASSTTQQQPAQTSTTQSSAAQQSTSQTPAQTSTTPTNAASTPSTPTTTFTSAVVTTDPGGQVVTSVVVVSDSTPSSAAASQTSASSNSSSGGSSGLSSSTIIGLSVAGGVAVLCIVGFFVWKFTRKRLGNYDDNEEIKWPELNAHDTAVPLPTNRTGGAGFDTAIDARRSSVGYAPSTAANSTAELQPDPYAVPPLPHLDPSQPYHDDPTSGFYDPYRGPVPQSFEPAGGQVGEVIPMTQLAGRRSPGPATAYGSDFVGGRVSPGPHAAYGSADFGGGRASPAPPPNYGADFGGRASPGLRAPYAGGRVSPGPQAAYGNVYGPR